MKKNLADYLSMPIQDATELELFNALLNLVTDSAAERGYNEGRKKLYYISAEFLIGKLLSNNLINLGLYDDVRAELEAAGRSLETLEEFETEPSLGNGGLGRLAACFIDSCATLGLPADGIGLAYHCGLFRQTFVNGRQHEIPDRWLVWGHESWMRRTGVSYRVPFGDFELPSVMYEIDVTGYDGKCGRLRLFDVDTIDERVIRDQISFDKKDIARSLTLFLYPDDSDEAGRMLRVYQEYFMVSNAAQLILDECVARGSDLHDLADYAAIQINDTHPTMVIPELIRLLGMRGIGIDEAIRIVTAACGYTNHTILAEALEKWPMSFLEKAVPQLVPIIEELDRRISAAYDDPFVQIIDGDGCVHMANIDIHFSHSTNGVAALHTEILKKSELRPFYEIYPEKFNNKTNGITFRRWLKSANPGLSGLITGRIGNSWIRNADELEKLLAWSDDESFLRSLAAVKKENKVRFAAWLYDHQGTKIDPDSVFDVQSKRLHEYKRQQLNLLWAIRTYQEIRNGKTPVRPVTVIFGAKAAPAYTIAKDIIHAILTLSALIESDPNVRPWLRVIMIENYNITAAEKLIPACDISEQISLASKEASGTSNMKFMLNGAVTLGTMDGANVEIADLVGPDNICTFGESSDTVIARYALGTYDPAAYVQADEALKKAVAFLTGRGMLAHGDRASLKWLQKELLTKDYFMTFPDFQDYCKAKERLLRDTLDETAWEKKMLVNIAKAGFFSSDRTILEYERDIWKLRDAA